MLIKTSFCSFNLICQQTTFCQNTLSNQMEHPPTQDVLVKRNSFCESDPTKNKQKKFLRGHRE